MLHRALVVAVLVALASGCKKGTPPPVEPPPSAGRSAAPRTDGIYAAKVQSVAPGDANEVGVDLLYFSDDGRVRSLSVSSASALEGAVHLLMSGTDRAASGTYTIKDGVLRFVLTSKIGSVEYAGAIKGEQLAVRWRSAINDASTEESFSFVLVERTAREGSAETTSDARGDAGAAGSSVRPPPDVALIPKGTSWYCFRAPALETSRCERKSATCETAYKEALASRSDLKLTRCAKLPAAFCHTAVRSGGSQGGAFCYMTEEECSAGVAGFDAPDVILSKCGRF